MNFIDDHSRLCLAAVALAVTTAVDVGAIFQQARAAYGTAVVLTDNGCISTAEHRRGRVVLETKLERPSDSIKKCGSLASQTADSHVTLSSAGQVLQA